ncbi:MAG: ExeA family protein [Desulfovermiculus sp.]
MTYYSLLGLRQEPFSNSPDPDLLYHSPATNRCLQELEIAVRLHRGLNVVFAQVGTGKTTICRTLLRQLHDDPHIQTFLILDPGYSTQLDFVRALSSTLGVPPPRKNDLQAYKDSIQNWLLTQVNDQGQTVALLIDEGQKIRDDCLEILRELLNFETNTAKLLQIALFAQTELKPRMLAVPNLMDRINFRYELGPFSLGQTKAMIEFRLAKSRMEDSRPIRLTSPAVLSIYRSTRGYPRKIIHLCHHTLIIMASRQDQTLRRKWVQQCLHEQSGSFQLQKFRIPFVILGVSAILILVFLLHPYFRPAGPGQNGTREANLDANPGKAPSVLTVSSNSWSDDQSILRRQISAQSPDKENAGQDFQTVAPGNSSQLQAPDRNVDQNGWPDLLGTMSLPSNGSIWSMSSAVYNTRDNRLQSQVILPAIAQANPDLDDLDQLKENTPVRFPVLPALATLAPQECRLSLFVSPKLSAGYEHFQKLNQKRKHDEPKIQLLALWDHRQGLRFHLVAGPGFQDPDQARQAKQELPARFRDQARILDWTGDNIRPIVFSSLGPGRGNL